MPPQRRLSLFPSPLPPFPFFSIPERKRRSLALRERRYSNMPVLRYCTVYVVGSVVCTRYCTREQRGKKTKSRYCDPVKQRQQRQATAERRLRRAVVRTDRKGCRVTIRGSFQLTPAFRQFEHNNMARGFLAPAYERLTESKFGTEGGEGGRLSLRRRLSFLLNVACIN